MIENTPLNSQSSADNTSCINGVSSWILGMFILLLFPLSSFGASITFDFRKLYTEEAREDITGADLLKYLNSEEVSPGFVQAIPDCNLAYGFNKGLKEEQAYDEATKKLSDYGALFFCSTDPETRADIGGITIQINPKHRHKFTKIVVNAYLDIISVSDQDFKPQLEVSINGGEFQKCDHTPRKPNYTASFSLLINEEIIKDVTFRIPNVHRKKDGSILDSDLGYYMAFTHINLLYNEETPEKVTDWRFTETSHIGYLNDEKQYVMPTLIALPSEAADMMELSSSSPEVADIEDGKVVLKGEGVAAITASLPENSLFIPSASYEPATYELTVKNSMSTAIELIQADTTENITLFDLQGRIVTGKATPGIYILKTDSSVRKVIIR